jgi:hypothetical protein
MRRSAQLHNTAAEYWRLAEMLSSVTVSATAVARLNERRRVAWAVR